MSMSFSSSEASTMFRSSMASSTSESVIFSKVSEKNAVEVKVCGKRQ